MSLFLAEGHLQVVHWREQALCSTVDPEMFFPEKTEGKIAYKLEIAAKKICGDCYVADQCLEDALKSNAMGIWAGTNEKERAMIQGRRIKRPYEITALSEYDSLLRDLGIDTKRRMKAAS